MADDPNRVNEELVNNTAGPEQRPAGEEQPSPAKTPDGAPAGDPPAKTPEGAPDEAPVLEPNGPDNRDPNKKADKKDKTNTSVGSIENRGFPLNAEDFANIERTDEYNPFDSPAKAFLWLISSKGGQLILQGTAREPAIGVGLVLKAGAYVTLGAMSAAVGGLMRSDKLMDSSKKFLEKSGIPLSKDGLENAVDHAGYNIIRYALTGAGLFSTELPKGYDLTGDLGKKNYEWVMGQYDKAQDIKAKLDAGVKVKLAGKEIAEMRVAELIYKKWFENPKQREALDKLNDEREDKKNSDKNKNRQDPNPGGDLTKDSNLPGENQGIKATFLGDGPAPNPNESQGVSSGKGNAPPVGEPDSHSSRMQKIREGFKGMIPSVESMKQRLPDRPRLPAGLPVMSAYLSSKIERPGADVFATNNIDSNSRPASIGTGMRNG